MSKKQFSTLPREISEATVENWLASGAISVSDYGHENTYYLDQFGHEFCCKNYPQENRSV